MQWWSHSQLLAAQIPKIDVIIHMLLACCLVRVSCTGASFASVVRSARASTSSSSATASALSGHLTLLLFLLCRVPLSRSRVSLVTLDVLVVCRVISFIAGVDRVFPIRRYPFSIVARPGSFNSMLRSKFTPVVCFTDCNLMPLGYHRDF